VKSVLELHPVNGHDYYLGHLPDRRLPGDPGRPPQPVRQHEHGARVAGDGGGYQIEHVVTGDTVTDVLKYVSYSREELVARVRRFAELAVRANRMSLEETRSMLRMYEEGLAGYTYLERS
jgi:arginine decarboxylase